MDNSYLGNKIIDLQARLRAENESNERDNLSQDISGGLSSPRHGSGRRPRILGEMGTPRRPIQQLNLPVGFFPPTKSHETSEIENKMKDIMQLSGILCINGKKYHTEIKDLEHLGELGNGTCGHVVKMLHKPSGTVIAVKQMRRSGNSEENKRIIMDLDVVLKSHDCPYIVQCLGCFITEADVWICMELMATCFDKLLKRLRTPVPEHILGKVTLATVKALDYLKEFHDVIHRDVKPSNILLDERGNVKLCDFGISGRLVDSKAKTKNAGCAAYMAPERIDPPDPRKPAYDIRADVWSLGITLVELATGVFPYRDCKCDFEVLSKVMQDDPPSLPSDQNFSPDFQEFVKCCLTKNYRHRPKYKMLLAHAFLKRYETEDVNVAAWFAQAMNHCEVSAPTTAATAAPTNFLTRRFTPHPPSPIARRHVPTPLHHHRSLSETTGIYQTNGDNHTPSGRFSPFRGGDPPPISPRYNATPPAPDWDRNRVPTSSVLSSPLSNRKRFTSEVAPINHNHPHGNTSPLVLQRFYYQQSQHHPSQVHHRSTSVSPCRQYTSESMKLEDSGSGGGKKRFSSVVKLQVGGGLPPPGPPHSPEPPPRHNRASPLLFRRHQNYLESTSPSVSPSPVRRVFQESSSPSLPRRYVQPSPPQPPPRRLSECSSVPGSPQHSQRRPARFHHTPEPQRRVWAASDLNDL